MALLHIPFEGIDENQLIRLIDAKSAETRDIEYKRDTYGHSEKDHAEWLADVSSFANTSGGDLIIGMAAKGGVPTEIVPLSISADEEITRLENIARSNLQPRIPNLRGRSIALSQGGEVLLFRVPRSFNPPHRIVRQGKGGNRFWARSSAGKYEPNVDELRTLFTFAPQLTERIRDFRSNRVAKIVAQDAPVQLIDASCLIMHVVPFSSFDPSSIISLTEIEKRPQAFLPIGSDAVGNWAINFDGILMTSHANRAAPTQRAYTQVYRSGSVEAVSSSITTGDRPEVVGPRMTTIKIERQILGALVRYLPGLQSLGVEPPFALMISLTGIKGVQINVGRANTWHDDDISILNRDQFHFSEVIIETIPTNIQECAVVVRPFIEQLANMAGRATSSSFGPNDEYLGFTP
jgi:hypothetical protein